MCTPEGYEFFRDQWRAVEVPRGCLILWYSQTAHDNKLADPGVDPQRRGIYISWQDRRLVPSSERASLKRKKLKAVHSGGSTDHWAHHISKVHRGGHYSNGKGLTKTLYNKERAPQYSEELRARMEEAF